MAILKDAFYFPHFSGARNDRKVKRLRKELGAEGYGIYFMVLEILRDQADFKYPLDDLDLLSDDIGSSEQKVRTVICNYGLFNVDESNYFFSSKFIEYLQPYIEKSARGKQAALIRWEKEKSKQSENEQTNNANASAFALQMQCDCNAEAMQREEIKENKEKRREEVEEEKLTPPTAQEIPLNETFKSIDVLRNECMADQINFVEHVRRNENISEIQVANALDAFIAFLKSGGETVKGTKDFRFHFQNWLKKQDKTKFRLNPQQAQELTPKKDAAYFEEKYKTRFSPDFSKLPRLGKRSPGNLPAGT